MTWADYLAGQRLFVAGVEQSPRRNAWNLASGFSVAWNTSTQMWDITASGGGGGGGHVVESNGTPLTQRANLNVTGLLQVSDSGGKTVLTLPNINLASQVTGTLPFARGGTGLGALGTALQVLRTNAAATAMEWATVVGHTIEDEGTPLTARTSLNFVGVNVSAADTGGKTVVTIGQVPLASGVSGTLPIANGGTGLTALGTALQSVRVNAGATALEYFTPGASLTGPANPGDNGKLAIASAGNLIYALATNAHIDPAAAVAYSKLAAGTAGRWLTINASGVVIESDTTLTNKTISYSAADAIGATLTLRKSRGTSAAPTAHSADDALAVYNAEGHDGSVFYSAGHTQYTAVGAGGTTKRARFESFIHDGTAKVETGSFERFPRTATTNATLTTVLSVSIAANTTVKLNIIWHGLETSPGTTNAAHRETALTVRRNGTGNVVEISHSDGVTLFKDDGSWGDDTQIGYALNTGTQAVDIKVQGKAATNITWTGEVSYSSFG